MNPDKPGYLTTEWWGTFLVHVITAVVTIASLFTHTPFDASGLQPLIPVAALVMSGIAQAMYSHGRAHVKGRVATADASVLTTQAQVVTAASISPASTVLPVTSDVTTTPL